MDLFSMNLDSLFCFAAHYGGAREQVLSDPMRIYHIEHGSGSGWTPEGQAKLFERIAAKGPFLRRQCRGSGHGGAHAPAGSAHDLQSRGLGHGGIRTERDAGRQQSGGIYRDLPA